MKAAETLSDREGESPMPSRPARTPLAPSEAEPIISYLLSPYETGYWELKANWETDSPLAIYLLEKLETLSEIDESSFAPDAVARKLPEEKREELIRVTTRLSAIHALFRQITKISFSESPEKPPTQDAWISRIDLLQLKKKFINAWTIYNEHIYFDSIQTRVIGSNPFRSKLGFAVHLEAPRQAGTLHIVSTEKSNICAFRDFYTALGAIQNATIGRVFAPDESLFKPYFTLVSSVLSHIIHDGQSSKVFAQALAYHEEEDYQHCISTLGLIAEDYLQRVYTSLLREQISSGLTLGETVNRIHKKIDDLFPQIKPTQKSLDSIYEKIRNLDATSNTETLKPVLRDLVVLMQEDRKHYGRRLDEIIKPSSKQTPFPHRISENLNELLKWRNAASHNSRVPLGAHEADRTLYCLVSLVTWWQEQLVEVDWSKSKIEIIESLLKAAKASSTK